MSIVTKENQRLYLSSWEYNAARIISELANIVKNNGGQVKPTNCAVISNRSLKASIQEAAERVTALTDAIKERGNNETRSEALERHSADLARLQAIGNDPITVTHTSYITFTQGGTYYYYQVDNNPFFDFYYIKTPIYSGKRSKDSCLEQDKKEWLFDCFFGFETCAGDITEAANLVYNMLMNANDSVIRKDSKKARVENRYNDGYHIETIYSPERFEAIEWEDKNNV